MILCGKEWSMTSLSEVCNVRNVEPKFVYFPQKISLFNLTKFKEVCYLLQEVITATIDLEDIRSYRARIRSRSHLAASNPPFPRIVVDFALSDDEDINLTTSPPMEWQYLTPEEEIELGRLLEKVFNKS